MAEQKTPEPLAALLALSPLDGRYAAATQTLRESCSEYALIKARVRVEIGWFRALAAHPQIPELPPLAPDAEAFLQKLQARFAPQQALRVKAIEAETKHDVKAVEYFLKERFAAAGVPALAAGAEFLHFACTSEDINNLAYALLWREARDAVLLPAAHKLQSALAETAHAHAALPLLALTHGQPASPTTLGKELANFAARLQTQTRRAAEVQIAAKWNGATGNYNAHLAAYPQVNWEQCAREFVQGFGLVWNPLTAQIEPHDWMAELCDAFARQNNVLLDFARDMWGYISRGVFAQRAAAGEVGSSTMPHKINPIDFENAEGNLGLANALLRHLSAKLPVSRWQRDLSDSTVLRSGGAAFGYTLIALQALRRGLGKVRPDEARMAAELRGAWEVLAEALQSAMRRYGEPQPYERLKALTRGAAAGGIKRETLAAFIETLQRVPAEERARLRALTPAAYTGLAAQLARTVQP